MTQAIMGMHNKAKKNKKGFTLVELIVVLVILGILMAIMVPSMVGWIGRANDQAGAVKGRAVLMAVQTIVAENYGTYGTGTTSVADANHLATIIKLAELENNASVTNINVVDGVVQGFTYGDDKIGQGWTYTFGNNPPYAPSNNP